MIQEKNFNKELAEVQALEWGQEFMRVRALRGKLNVLIKAEHLLALAEQQGFDVAKAALAVEFAKYSWMMSRAWIEAYTEYLQEHQAEWQAKVNAFNTLLKTATDRPQDTDGPSVSGNLNQDNTTGVNMLPNPLILSNDNTQLCGKDSPEIGCQHGKYGDNRQYHTDRS
ncbi:hypothetical protein [Lonepinella sp. BR2919]|uniref:hypothetical protein n=1 Tax=unclassified Lonepinella TaxID=2642006 RepID=UPI003F6E363D